MPLLTLATQPEINVITSRQRQCDRLVERIGAIRCARVFDRAIRLPGDGEWRCTATSTHAREDPTRRRHCDHRYRRVAGVPRVRNLPALAPDDLGAGADGTA